MNLREKLPARLAKEPLLEAIWEIRFQSDQQAVSEVLTSVIFQKMKGDITETVRLPTASLSKEIRDQQKELTYTVSVRMVGSNFTYSVGERVVALSAIRPYCGWGEFRKKIVELLTLVESTGFVKEVESFSMKYVDCLTEPVLTNLGALAVKVNIAERDMKGEPLYLRTEFTELDLTHIVQIALPVDVALKGGEKLHGIMVDVDTHCRAPKNLNAFHAWIEAQLDGVHKANKTVFFSQLTDETIGLLDPVYN